MKTGMRSVSAGVVYSERAAVEVRSIEGVDSILGSGRIRELAEAETLCAAGFSIHDDSDVGDLAGLTEEITDVFFGALVGQVADVDGASGLLPIHFC